MQLVTIVGYFKPQNGTSIYAVSTAPYSLIEMY